jgi:hypothetical protein
MSILTLDAAGSLFLKLFLSSDHVTAATGKSPVVVVLKHGGSAFGSSVGSVTEISNGWYKWTYTADEVDTEGFLIVRATATACDPFEREYVVSHGANRADLLLRDYQQTAQGYGGSTITLADPSNAYNGCVLDIETEDYKQMVTITDIDKTTSTAWVATVDPPFSPVLSGTIVYSTYAAPRNPEDNLPKSNVWKFKDTDILTGGDPIALLTTQASTLGTPSGASVSADLLTVMNKTNSLTFTVPGYADVNVQYVNDVQLQGVGTEDNPMRPA